MKDFLIRVITLVLIIGLLMGYNSVAAVRETAEEALRQEAEAEAAARQEEYAAVPEDTGVSAEEENGSGSSSGGYKDGTYTGASEGYGGLITVEVTIRGGEIRSIEILSAPGEDSAYLSSAEAMIPEMIKAQTSAVDTASGATMSSVGLANAVTLALNKALDR